MVLPRLNYKTEPLSSESGNAVIEFLLAGVGLQLALLVLTTSLATQIDSQGLANLLARQVTRSAQLGLQGDALQQQVDTFANSMNLPSGDIQFTLTGDCSTVLRVEVQVRNSQVKLNAPCN